MKRIYILSLIFVIITSVLFAEVNSTGQQRDKHYFENLRLTYYAGVENENYIDSLENMLVKKFGTDTAQYSPIALAYLGGLEALKSKHAFWPFDKMSYLNDSMDLFAEALEKEPSNLEIRFMRFSILYYVPGILGYQSEEESDLRKVYNLLLEKEFSSVDYEIQEGMAEFLLNSDMLTNEEENILVNRFTLARNE